MTYEVVVGCVGTVTKTRRPALAAEVFNDYVAMSKANLGRAGLQPVYLLKGGEPTWEFHPEMILRERLRDAVMKAIDEAVERGLDAETVTNELLDLAGHRKGYYTDSQSVTMKNAL